MENNFNKFDQYLEEVERQKENNPAIIHEKEFYDLWYNIQKPTTFVIQKKKINTLLGPLKFGNEMLNKIAYFNWFHEHKTPGFTIEASADQHIHYLVNSRQDDTSWKIEALEKDNDPDFLKEITYEVIAYLKKEKPWLDIKKIKKKEFVSIVEAVNESNLFDERKIKSVKKMKFSEIKESINEAAKDFARDDLAPQLSLAFDAPEHAEHVGEPVGTERSYTLPHWKIMNTLEFLIQYLEQQVNESVHFSQPLTGSKIVNAISEKEFLIELKLIDDTVVREGDILLVLNKQTKELQGTIKIDFLDQHTAAGKFKTSNHIDFEDIKKNSIVKLRENSQKAELYLLKEIHHDFRLKTQPSPPLEKTLGMTAQKIKFPPPIKIFSGLDESQSKALALSMDTTQPVVMIQGPPGTGKSHTLEKIIKKLHSQGNKILFTAPSNTAVDNICKRTKDLPIARLGNFEEKISDEIKPYWIENRLKTKGFSKEENTIYCGTHSTCFKDRTVFKELETKGLFDVCILDEAGMTKVHELTLLASFCKKIILLGDQKQLPPFPPSENTKNRLKKKLYPLSARSLKLCEMSAMTYLERELNFPYVILEKSYRCQNPRLLRFASLYFYDDIVKTSESAAYHQLSYHERIKRYPRSSLKIIDTSQCSPEIKGETFSYSANKPGLENKLEARLCVRFFRESLRKTRFDEISIIAPYKKQMGLIRGYLNNEKQELMSRYNITKKQWESILYNNISTVDSFQGGESDIIIISYTRSNQGEGLGFIENHNRINVAHTRSREEMIVICDLECLKSQEKSGIFTKMERAVSRDGEIIQLDNEEADDLMNQHRSLFDFD